jgi:hypothetical protein
LPLTWLHKLYDASISVGVDGSMLVSSTRDRVMAWGLVFCILGALGLTTWLLRRRRRGGGLGLGVFGAALIIPVFIMPSVRQEYIQVSPAGITVDTGAWYRPSRTVFPISRGDIIRETRDGLLPGNLMGDPGVSWHVTRPDGNEEVLELNDFFAAHRMVVAYYIKDRGFVLQRLEDRAPGSP